MFKNMFKIIFYAFLVLFYISCSSKETITKTSLESKPPKALTLGYSPIPAPLISPVQKLADEPKDTPIRVRTSSGRTLCYNPVFTISGSYVELVSCSSGAKEARYDVFGRLGFLIDDVWLCITAPAVVVYQGWSSDYVFLSPCSIESSVQQWKLKDGVFYSNDDRYLLKDDGSYVYAASKFNSKLSFHKLDSSMDEWVNTIAKPGNLSVMITLSWELNGERYVVYNDESAKVGMYLFTTLRVGISRNMIASLANCFVCIPTLANRLGIGLAGGYARTKTRQKTIRRFLRLLL